MRNILHPLVLLIALCALLPAAASAGTANVVCFHGELTSSMEADGLHVQITVVWWDWDNCWLTEPLFVDVYRRALGSTCTPLVLLTDQPLQWPAVPQGGGPVALGEVVDGDAVANTAYEYIVRAVGANRDPIAGDDDVVVGYASDGDALVGHGTLVAGPDCGMSSVSSLNPCQDACFPFANVGSYPAEVNAYFNTDTELLVYGHFDAVWAYLCNVHIPRVTISSVTPSPCILAVEPASWGAVKSIYR